MTRPAESRYRGFRITLTETPGSEHCWVTLAVKQRTGRWDDWSLLFPAVRMDLEDPDVAPSLEDLIGQAVRALQRELRC